MGISQVVAPTIGGMLAFSPLPAMLSCNSPLRLGSAGTNSRHR